MRALVTGGSGHLGSRLVRKLLERGAQVRVSYRPGDRSLAIDDLPQVEHRPADLLDPEAIKHAVEGVDVVFHTAAMVVFKPKFYDLQMRTNVEGTQNFLDAAREAGVRRFVHTSSVSSLGFPQKGCVGDEDTPYNWAPFKLGYNDSKRASEALVIEAAKDLDTVVLQPGTMFGPGDFNFNASTYMQVIERGPLVFAPPGGTCVVHVDDAAEGHLLAFEKGKRGERYVLGGEPLRLHELFTLVEAELKSGHKIRRMPRWVLLGAGRLGSFARALKIPVPLTHGLALAVAEHLAYSSAKAQRELGWTYRPAKETLSEAVRWYLEHKHAAVA